MYHDTWLHLASFEGWCSKIREAFEDIVKFPKMRRGEFRKSFPEDIMSQKEITSNSHKKASAKLNDRKRSGLKFRLLSSRFTCDQSSGKLEISEIPPSPGRYPIHWKNCYAKLERSWERALRRIPLSWATLFHYLPPTSQPPVTPCHFSVCFLPSLRVGTTTVERWSGILIDLNFTRISLSGLFQLQFAKPSTF